ncbi:MAG: ABC transporter ATP-binding protein [Gammaproteobacteria bacterium]|nr:ABC transporter ATP-binding protein [Gammaproteobacteria bacterium]
MKSKALAVVDLHKTYPNGSVALSGVSVEVESGEFFALLGPNGAGKSTLIGIVSSLVNKTQGKVFVYGYDMDSHSEAAKACIGIVPQEFNFNLWEQVIDIVVNQAGYYGLPRGLALERAEKYLRQVGLWEKRHQRSRELSGGMKRRLMIARALVHEPKLLILDEPTAGVDIELRRSMWDFLRRLNAGGTTIILTTHYLEEAESLCESIAIIDHGKIIEDTNMKALINRLHTETFILDLAEPLEKLPVTDGYVLRQVDSTTLEVDISKDQGINKLFGYLSDQGIRVTSLRNKSNRLEELFIRMITADDEPQSDQDKNETPDSGETEMR